MEKNGYKTLAIILGVICIAQFAFIGWSWSLGSDIVDTENECAYNFCSEYNTYYYDYAENMCYCFENDEVAAEKFMGGGK